MDNTTKGIIYAILSSLFVLPWYIFGKLGFEYYNFVTVLALWFGFSAVVSFIMIIISKKLNEYRTFLTHWKWVILAVSLNVISITSGFYALKVIGPSLVGFLGRMSMLMMVLMGVIFLNEKFNNKELISGFIIAVGVILISFSKGEFIILGVLLMLAQSVFVSIWRYIVKAKMHDIDPLLIVNYRAVIVGVYFFAFAILTGQFEVTYSAGLYYATIPSIFSVIFLHLYKFKAYKLIDFSKVALLNALSPLFVVVLAFLVFGEVLTGIQIWGAVLIMVGVFGLIIYREKVKI